VILDVRLGLGLLELLA